MSGFCTDCRFRVESFEGLMKCPNCGTKSSPCNDANQVTVSINWHELYLLCVWAENWGRQIKEAGIVYGIAQALEEQHPERHPLTLAGEINDMQRRDIKATLHDSDGKRIET